MAFSHGFSVRLSKFTKGKFFDNLFLLPFTRGANNSGGHWIYYVPILMLKLCYFCLMFIILSQPQMYSVYCKNKGISLAVAILLEGTFLLHIKSIVFWYCFLISLTTMVLRNHFCNQILYNRDQNYAFQSKIIIFQTKKVLSRKNLWSLWSGCLMVCSWCYFLCI